MIRGSSVELQFFRSAKSRMPNILFRSTKSRTPNILFRKAVSKVPNCDIVVFISFFRMKTTNLFSEFSPEFLWSVSAGTWHSTY